MATAHIEYLGDLRTKATHLRSQNHIFTDAPVDNNGKGENFSPTDLVATALVACQITVMGIAAKAHHISIGTVEGTVVKVMSENPRRISGLQVKITFRDSSFTDKEKAILVHTAHTCPVAQSLHPDIKLEVEFEYL